MTQAIHRQPLDRALRRALEATVVKARDIAEQAATQALKRLSVGDAKPADYLSDEQRKLRTRLRSHGRQLGDSKDANGQQSIYKLVTEVAYEHWHRMLFARFLEQNSLLMYDEHTSLTLAECAELVQDPDVARDELERHCQSGWELAGVLASKMLPQIFRIDSPVFELEFAPEHQRSLEQLVIGLALETFQAQDSLGWVYQFWQSKRKEEVNKSEVKIGADELSPVTQLFTEPYMVSFLLDNSLGAWWAGQRLSDSDWQHANSEQELRDKAAIPGVPLSFLRFVQDETTQQWKPASGTFDAWPKQLSELKALDPCCGSGHFLVAAFLMLVPMRMQAENLMAQQAIDRVLSENLHGLELDQRCVELAAFAVALEAWRYSNAGGYRPLPELHLACSGLAISTSKEEWLLLAQDISDLRGVLGEIYEHFKDAPVLGSLINPELSLGKGSLFELKWEEVGPLLTKALANEKSDEYSEMGVVAKGLFKATSLLADKYSLILTNVPFLATRKQNDILLSYLEKYHYDERFDLAVAMMSRILALLCPGGAASIVTPQTWHYLSSYKSFRERLVNNYFLRSCVRLGTGAFETISGQVVNASLTIVVNAKKSCGSQYSAIDVSEDNSVQLKARGLIGRNLALVGHDALVATKDFPILMKEEGGVESLEDFSSALAGVATGDSLRFYRAIWEVQNLKPNYEFLHGSLERTSHCGGFSQAILWEEGEGSLYEFVLSMKHLNSAAQRWKTGQDAWGKMGVSASRMGNIVRTIYRGSIFDQNLAVIVPKNESDLPAIWAYCESDEYLKNLRNANPNLAISSSTVAEVPFDLDYWARIAEERYPNGLPQAYTNDSTQWIFHGHPCGSVIWDEQAKWTAHGELRVDDSVLQVAISRLLGYRWPAELDGEMDLAVEQREWVQSCQALDAYVDDDGIVCLPAVRGEKAADQRLEALLQAAYGSAWTTPLKNRLLETVGSKSLSLWLRDKFFEQHCKMFQHRPFIWHIWDGLKDGFSALVNYHKLDKSGLERLIYTYLGDWIRTQQAGMANGEDGAQERLLAAEALKRELEAILEGEAPYDIFVRWKPLAEQPIGWTPDLNDGVRLNIRPFLNARDVGKKGAGILRWMPNIKWAKDRGKDVESSPWYTLGLQYDEGEGARINDHHLSLAEKQKARS